MGAGPEIWVVDMEREAATRSEGDGLYPLWAPDGTRMAFESVNSLSVYVRNIIAQRRKKLSSATTSARF